MATNAEQIAQLYVGYLNRAPEPEGLNYWIGRLTDTVNPLTISQIANNFATQPETTAIYPYLRYPNVLDGDTEGFITEIYQNLFARAPEAEGLAYWTAQLETGAVEIGDFILTVIQSARNFDGGQDLTTLNNKTAVGLSYAEQVAGANVDWTLGSARLALQGVDSTDASVAAAEAVIADFVNNAVVDGETVNLTIGNDTFTANIFDAPLVITQGLAGVQTLNQADVLTGIGEAPTLNATLNGLAGLSPTLRGVEVLNLETVAASVFNAVNTTGATAIAHKANAGGDLTVRNLNSNAEISVEDGQAGTDTLVRFTSNVVGGTDDVATLVLSNNGSADVASGVVNLRGEIAGGFETINVTANGVNRLTDLGSDNSAALGANITQTNSLRTLNVDGEGRLRVDQVLDRVTSIDASKNEGGVRFSIDTGVVATVVGGSGNDNINFGTGLTIADKFDGGEGRDTIQVSTIAGLAAGNQITNVEILRVNDAATGTINLSNVSSVDAIIHNSTAAVTYNNFSAAGAADAANGLTVLNTGAATVGVQGAAAGIADVLEVTYGNADTNTNFNAGGLTAANVEQLNLHVVQSDTGNAAAATGTLTVANAINVTVDGGVIDATFSVNGGAALGTAGTLARIDASAFVGNLGVVDTATTSLAASTVGVSGNAGAQTIIGGSGADVLATGGRAAYVAPVGTTPGTAGDVLTGGAGNDLFVFTATDRMNGPDGAGSAVEISGAFTAGALREFTTITDLNLGGANAASRVDALSLTEASAGFDNNATILNAGAAASIGGTSLEAALNTAFAGAGANSIGLFTYGSETFLAGSVAGAAWAGGTDLVIRVTGVTGTLDASDLFAA